MSVVFSVVPFDVVSGRNLSCPICTNGFSEETEIVAHCDNETAALIDFVCRPCITSWLMDLRATECPTCLKPVQLLVDEHINGQELPLLPPNPFDENSPSPEPTVQQNALEQLASEQAGPVAIINRLVQLGPNHQLSEAETAAINDRLLLGIQQMMAALAEMDDEPFPDEKN